MSDLPTRKLVQQYIDRCWTAPDDKIFTAYVDGTLMTAEEWHAATVKARIHSMMLEDTDE